MGMVSGWLDTLIEFLPYYVAVYGINVFLYFATGWVLVTIQNRHPERRIQQHRRGEKRRGKEIRQSVLSLTVTGGCLAGGIFASVKGWTFVEPLPLTWWSAILMFVVSVIAFDAWFYWAHRFMHTKLMYRFHAEHHRSVAPTVWSTYSDDLVDAFVMQSYYLWAVFILPIPVEVLIVHRLWDHFNGTIGHSGFEFWASPLSRMPSPMVCVTFHDQHHSRFKYNYANFFSFWDRVCDTIDPKYDDTVRYFEALGDKAERKRAAAE
ncbi:sterol desaturase family protein [Polymorphum gilvum]|uniref:Sterol desaturase family protein n=1 Tax=Polymorphum gilvum (strain LMG 25793 / CGMCC 1.9160 / SL003B-26A1) TaxID=991905 RepID=F2IUW9_POLGS|nr:sterol desaturase family protein [Polymorphum gilvum]ADZ70198.1 Sterol desaturase family protein [Polymorphum gilvum SL003B-26A1]